MFHGEEGPSLILRDFIDMDNIGVAELGCRLRLAFETGAAILVVAEMLRQEFEGDLAVSSARYTSPMPPAPILSTIR